MDISGNFTGLSGVYKKYRPGYPDACFDALLRESGLNEGDTVADIGSGTGLFTRGLIARGLRVFAVEPNGDMRKAADEALSSYSGFVSVAAPAEHTSLPDGSVKLVTAAQSFHWFDAAAFTAECHRILTPDGHAALIWNSRDLSQPLIVENERLCRQYCPAFTGFSGGIDERPGVFEAFFRKGKYRLLTIDNPLLLDQDAFIGRNLASSFAPRPEQENYAPFKKALTGLFARYAQDGVLTFPNITRCYWGRV